MQSLEGKVAVVTGAASGIGFAMAKRFAAEGMKLALADIETGALESAAATLRSSGAEVFTLRCDVAKLPDVQSLAAKSREHFGSVHVVCNNAGVATAGLLTESTIRDWEWVVGVNLWGVIHGVHAFLPILLEQGEDCHIVNTASIAGLITGPGMGIYCTTKHAVVALSEALYHEMQILQTKVGVSVLCPAWVSTKIVDSDRNRPSELLNENPNLSSVGELMREHTRHVVDNGLPPDVIADHVVDAVLADRFYILTHPELTPAIHMRMGAITDGTAPKFVPPPGIDNLMAH
ncbi:MAG: SDR family NAD(P)-dependent oxidoreductase [Candidatus Hydrogenedentes bacterium]|nr:SDR family NAD(P)-dependent oxidoreductase [Candidatus Hydrogenedentota bacterium]